MLRLRVSSGSSSFGTSRMPQMPSPPQVDLALGACDGRMFEHGGRRGGGRGGGGREVRRASRCVGLRVVNRQ